MPRKKKIVEDVEEAPLEEEAIELTRSERRLMQPGGCRQYMRKRLAKEFDGIVTGFVEVAKTGSCQHVKLATELLGPTRKGTPRRKGAAQKMLEELERVSRSKEKTDILPSTQGAEGDWTEASA